MAKKHTKSELILEQECCNIARQKGLVAVKLEKNKHKGIICLFRREGGVYLLNLSDRMAKVLHQMSSYFGRNFWGTRIGLLII